MVGRWKGTSTLTIWKPDLEFKISGGETTTLILLITLISLIIYYLYLYY